MKILAIDSSGLVASVAYIDGSVLRAEYTIDYKKTHSQTLLPMLDEISRMVGLDVSDADAVAVACGPGSFTGLRIGSSTAKGICLASGKPLVEVPTLAGLAYNLFGARGLICPIMDARRGQVYNGLYSFEGGRLVTVEDQRALSVEELAEDLEKRAPEQVIFLGDGVEVYRDRLDAMLSIPHIYAPASSARQRAASVGALGAVLFAEGAAIPGSAHVPLYLRKSQAERERENRERGQNETEGQS